MLDSHCAITVHAKSLEWDNYFVFFHWELQCFGTADHKNRGMNSITGTNYDIIVRTKLLDDNENA